MKSKADLRKVWINNGRLLLIPLQQSNKTAEPLAQALTLREAFSYIQRSRSTLVYLALVEAEAFYRLRNYPNQISESLQRTPVIIPRKLAYILHENSAYISPAVEAFYLRDPIALRPLQTQNPLKLVFPPEDLVTVQVKITKVGFAQLKSQHFPALSLWQSILSIQESPKAIAQAAMGMRITSGFEMLLADPQHRDKKSVREIKVLLDDVEQWEAQYPSDADIAKWEFLEDDESWLDINYEDFEKELAGKAKLDANTTVGGFGHKSAHENLRKIVARFEDFLNDDTAGANGAGYLDDMDNDDDDDSGNRELDMDEISDSHGDGEGQEVSLNEVEFAEMMREVIGLSTEEDSIDVCQRDTSEERDDRNEVYEAHEGAEIRRVMEDMEAELRDAGALDPQPGEPAMRKGPPEGAQKEHGCPDRGEFDRVDDDSQEVTIDYNLAKNLLESFKSQAGMAGPGGNILRSMGLQLPRDEDTDS